MEKFYKLPRRGLTLVQTLALCGVLFLLYRVFKTPELDSEISKYFKKESIEPL